MLLSLLDFNPESFDSLPYKFMTYKKLVSDLQKRIYKLKLLLKKTFLYVEKTGDKERDPVIAIAALTAAAISGASTILGNVNHVEIQNIKSKMEQFLLELETYKSPSLDFQENQATVNVEIYNSLKQIENKLNFKIDEANLIMDLQLLILL